MNKRILEKSTTYDDGMTEIKEGGTKFFGWIAWSL